MFAASKVTEVKMYRNSATVLRSGSVLLSSGKNIVFVGGMSKSAKKDSFLVKLPAGIRTVNIQLVGVEEAGEEILESQKIAKQIAELNYQSELCDKLAGLYEKNGDFSQRTDVSVADQENYLNTLTQKLMALHEKAGALNEEKEKLSLELSKAEKEEERPLIMLELMAEADGEYPFTLEYQETTGGWVPKYEIRYNGEKNPLAVYMKAKISQSSGEDWKQTKVTLYSGNPSLSQAIPSLGCTQLSIRDVNLSAARAAVASADAMMGQAMMASTPMAGGMAMAMMAQARTAEATVSEEESMTAYELPDLRDILSDTDGNMADLQSFSVDAKINVFSIPSASDTCYLTAKVVTADWPLPAANASIYINDLYAGDVHVNPETAEEEFLLSLGRDERLKVLRKELPVQTKDVFLKGQKRKAYEYSIKFTNKSSEKINVEIMDSIPVSTDKSIVVDVTELSGGVLDPEFGKLKWNVEVDGQSGKELKFAYSISWPKEKELQRSRRNISVSSSTTPVNNNMNMGMMGMGGLKKCSKCGGMGTGKFCPECGSVF